MATVLPSPTSSSRFFFPHYHHHLHNKKWPHAPLTRLSFTNCSSPFSLQETSQPTAVTESDDKSAIENSEALPFRGCKTCGREEVEKGCNGEGRIQGGIATVPGFGWWPIKAYRPCPGFIASGGRYRRRGQNMDEVAFGKERENPIVSIDQVQSSKKRQSPPRFKR